MGTVKMVRACATNNFILETSRGLGVFRLNKIIIKSRSGPSSHIKNFQLYVRTQFLSAKS